MLCYSQDVTHTSEINNSYLNFSSLLAYRMLTPMARSWFFLLLVTFMPHGMWRVTLKVNSIKQHQHTKNRYGVNSTVNTMAENKMRQDGVLVGFGWMLNSRIRSVPGNNTLPRTISAMMQPTDQTSTEKWNDNHPISMQGWRKQKKPMQTTTEHTIKWRKK